MKMKKEMIKDRIKETMLVIIPAIITSLILLFIYLVKGIYPFGDMTVIHADMGQIFVNNFIYYIESIYSGELGNFIYSNELNTGTKMLGSALPSGFFSPFSLMFLLCKDVTKLPYAMSIFLIIKVGLSAVTAYICFKELFGKENYKFNVVFSVQYALSSFVLINYTTIIWLDVIIIFPLLILALKNILNKKSFVPYSILITISIMIHYQMTYVILFMILATLIFAIKQYSKEDRKEIIFRLGLGTIFGLLLPSVIFLPAIELFLNSYRVTMQQEFFYMETFYTKVSYLLFSGITLYGFIKLQKNIKKDKNVQLIDIFIVLTGLMPIIFEGINEIWHGGKYDRFPFRFGFIPTFFMNIAANYYYSKCMINKEVDETKVPSAFIEFLKAVLLIVLIILALVCAIGVCYITGKSNPAFSTSYQVDILLVVYNIITYILLELVHFDEKSDFVHKLAIIELIIFAFGFVGIKEEYRGFLHSDWHIFKAFRIREEFEEYLDFESGYRYKDLDFLMLENTPLVTRLPSNSSWILSSKEQVEFHTNLGYSRLHLRLNSMGGTIFSDAILNLKYTFSKKELNESLYKKIAVDNYGIKLYETKNAFPVGIVYDSENNLETVPNDLNKIQFTNWIYKNLFSKEDDILKIEEKQSTLNNSKNNGNHDSIDNYTNEKCIQLELNVQGEKNLYFIEKRNMNSIEIEVNGKNYGIYPNEFFNGIVDLGVYKDENVNIKIYFFSEIDIDDFEIASIDLEQFSELFSNNINTNYQTIENQITVEVTVDEDNKKIFLPVSYDKNWVAKINGKEVQIEKALGSMLSLELEKGYNNIELTLKNNTIKIGLIITIISAIGLVIVELSMNKLRNIKLLKNSVYVIYNIIVVIFFVIVYLGGIIITFVS